MKSANRILPILGILALLIAFGSCGDQAPKKKKEPKTEKDTELIVSSQAPEYRVKKFVCMIPYENETFEENAYVLYDERSKDGVIIDPGYVNAEMEAFVEANHIQVKAILNTHGHSDHVSANADYKAKYNVPCMGPLLDKPVYSETSETNEPTRYLENEKELSLGNIQLEVLGTPGHSRGSLCFLAGEHLLCGDTLFKGSVGRTWDDETHTADENLQLLIGTIRKQILPLPNSTAIHPGHGDETTVEMEKRNNEWLQAEEED